MLGAEEKNSEGPLSMGTHCVLDGGNMDILGPFSEPHMPMCIEKWRDVHEKYLLFSDMRTISFIFYLKKKKKKEITALHRPEDQREVEKGS